MGVRVNAVTWSHLEVGGKVFTDVIEKGIVLCGAVKKWIESNGQEFTAVNVNSLIVMRK